MQALRVKKNVNTEPEYPFWPVINKDIERVVQDCNL